MKTPIILLTTIGIFTLSASYAQESNSKKITDPSYSVHNYKHPIKALKARQIAAGKAPTQFVIIKEVIPTLAESGRNYKKHQRSKIIATQQESEPVKNRSGD